MSRNIFDLPGLIGWLEREDPVQSYSLWWKPTCLLGRYFGAHGMPPSGRWYDAFSYGGVRLHRFHLLVRVVCAEPQTYGAALERARTMQARRRRTRHKAGSFALSEAGRAAEGVEHVSTRVPAANGLAVTVGGAGSTMGTR